jgi:hypothetical protein
MHQNQTLPATKPANCLSKLHNSPLIVKIKILPPQSQALSSNYPNISVFTLPSSKGRVGKAISSPV